MRTPEESPAPQDCAADAKAGRTGFVSIRISGPYVTEYERTKQLADKTKWVDKKGFAGM